MRDIVFTLTRAASFNENTINGIVSKIVVIDGFNYINLNNVSNILGVMGINKLVIFSIDNELKDMNINIINKKSEVSYIEINKKQFVKLLESTSDFLTYNKHCLYILRNGSFLGIKNLFTTINSYQIEIGRGGGQKAHILSPLDLRLSVYLMAMFGLNYNSVISLNTFNNLGKDRYLSYKERPLIRYVEPKSKQYKPLFIENMPAYCFEDDLTEYCFNCLKCN